MMMKISSALSLVEKAKRENLDHSQCLTVIIFSQVDSAKVLEVDSVPAHSAVLLSGDKVVSLNQPVQLQRLCKY